MAKEELPDKNRVYDRQLQDPSEPLNPLYAATTQNVPSEHSSLSRRHTRQKHNQAPDDLSAGSGQYPGTLGRHQKYSTVNDVSVTRHGSDIGQRPPPEGLQSAGSMPSITGHGIPASIMAMKTSTLSSDQQQSSRGSGENIAEQAPRGGSAVSTVLPSPAEQTIKPPAQPIQTKLIRLPSVRKSLSSLPRVNCPEKIIICMDISKEMEKQNFAFRQGNKTTPVELIKKALNMFVQMKHILGFHHEFALMFLENTAKWACDFTNDPSRIAAHLDAFKNCVETEQCTLSSVYSEISKHVQLPDSSLPLPPYIVRVVLIYGRSFCKPSMTETKHEKHFQLSDYFFMDVIYIHDPPTADNMCESIFDALCSIDVKGTSYIVEASKNPTKVFDCTAQLLAHPLQRVIQQNVSYAIPTNGL